MIFPGFIGPSYTSLSVNADAQRCLNLYLEVLESQQGKNKFALYGTPGLKTFGTPLDNSPVRGLCAGDGRLFVVAGNNSISGVHYLEVNSAGAVIRNGGDMPGDNGDGTPARMFQNGTVVWIVVGGATYYDIGGLSLLTPTYATGGNVLAKMGAYVDGYFMAQVPDTNTVQISPPLDNTGVWDVLQSFSKESAPDRLLGIWNDHGEIYLFGEETSEVWEDTGNGFNGFAFQRNPSGNMQVGISSPWTAASFHHGVGWLSQDSRGGPVAMFATGFQPTRISTHAVEEKWATYPTAQDAEGYAYTENGHEFWAIHFLSGNASWYYDATASEQLGQPIWHERAYNGTTGRQRQHVHAFAFQKHIVGDYLTGQLWQQDLGTFTDGGAPITRMRTCPHLCSENLRAFGHQLEIEMEVGNGSLSPTIAWSNDRGHTFGVEHHGRLSTAQAVGSPNAQSVTENYSQRMILDRLGYWRDRIFRFTCSDNQKIALINAYLRSTQGTS